MKISDLLLAGVLVVLLALALGFGVGVPELLGLAVLFVALAAGLRWLSARTRDRHAERH